MLYRKFGKTGEQVSILGFGYMRLPVLDGQTDNIDEERAMEMLLHPPIAKKVGAIIG